eukprot:XP_014048847.1 PREDICTED: hemicentin-1-like isoform X1 [Salmo salar]
MSSFLYVFTVVTFPLELNPPRVVVRYGDSVSVNCSTSFTDHEGMGWEATFGGTGFEQEVNVVTWTVDNLIDWTIEPTCYITLIDGEQPSEVLPVILYKTPDSISISVLRHSGPMVEGTEYQLQCDIQNIAPLQNLVVKWYKGNEPLDNVTYSIVSKTPVDVSDTLMISPSRHDDGAQYRCRAQLDLGPEGPQPHPTVTSEPLNITVHYAPEFLPGNDTVEVSAGSDVSLDCSAEGNPPPELRWTNNTAEGNANETTVGRLRTLNISRVTANATYNCTVTNRLGSITKQIHVLVEVPPQQHPTMFSTAPSTPGTMTTLPATAKPKLVTFPLELNPPRVVVRYGDSVSVNCSTSFTDHEGMGWEATFGGTGFEQEVNVVTWTVDNLIDWTIEPTCYITLIDGEQPSEVLPVILYKTPDSISISVLRHSGPMVEGTEYQLQCDIQNIAPQQNLVVKWYKGNEPLDNVTYSIVSKTPVDVSDTLIISPSRHDDGAQYRCRAELDLGPEGPQPHPTVTSEPLNITVHYAPEFLPGNDTVEVSAGSDVSLDCSAEGNPPPELRWTNNTAEGNANETTVGRLRTLNISRVTANATYNCTVTNRLGSITKQIHVLVEVPPQQHPTMFSTAPSTPGTMTTLPATAKPKLVTFPLELNPPRVVVRYGDSVSVNCSTSFTDHEGMGWEATFGGTGFEQEVNVVTWTVDNLIDWTIEPTCYITLIDGEQPSEVLPVILYKTPDSISISVLRHSGPMVEGTEYQLQCDIQNIAPLQNLVVKWYKGNEPLDNVTYSIVSKTPVDVSDTLMISPSRHDDGAQYRCRAQLDLGPEGPQPHPTVTSEPLNITVHYAPEFLPGNDTVEVSAGSDVSLDCSAEGNPPPELRWTNNTAEGNANETTVGRLRTLNISRVTANATYNCTVTNRLGSITKQIHVLVEVPPQQHPTMFSTAPSTPGTMTTLPATAKPKLVTFPLELNPPRVVVRYGDSVSVNCSTSFTDHEGMGWEATFGGTGFEQEVNVVTWTVDNLIDWTIEPTCYITLIDGEQPSEVLPVILYKTPDSISISVLRHSGPMVKGTEYQLQCDIQNIAPLQNLVVKWYKGNEPLDNVTYSIVSKTPVDVSDTLMISPSRHDDGAQYRCRAQLDLGPEGPQPHPTVTSEPLNITVHYAPEFLPGNDTVEVSAGSDVSLDCSAEGNPPPELRWTNNTAEGNANETTVGRLRTLNISRVTANATYNCTVTNRLGSITKHQNLSTLLYTVSWLLILIFFINQKHMTGMASNSN